MNWLITGGCGFIGLNLVKKLYEDRGHSIRILDNLYHHSTGGTDGLMKVCHFRRKGESDCFTEVEFIQGDITDLKIVSSAARGADIIVHLAAIAGVRESVKSPSPYIQNNIVGTFNVLESAYRRGVPQVINASSGAAVGDCTPPIREETIARPVSPYGASKLSGEALCHAYNASYKNVITKSLRFSNVYGPYSQHKNSLVAKFIKYALDGKEFEIYGDGKQTRDFIHVDDLVSAIIKSTSVDAHGVYQISTGIETSIDNIVIKLSKSLNRTGIDTDHKVRYGAKQIGDARTNWADNSKAKKVLQWEPKVDLSTGIHQTVDWFILNNKKKSEDRKIPRPS